MIKWTRTSGIRRCDGSREIKYGCAEYPDLVLVSETIKIDHANGIGYWLHNEFFLIDRKTGASRNFRTLKEAKAFVEDNAAWK